MANDYGGGGTTMIALVVGALLVLVIGLYATGSFGPRRDTTSVTIDTPSVPATPEAPTTTPPTPTDPAPVEPMPSEPTPTPAEPPTP